MGYVVIASLKSVAGGFLVGNQKAEKLCPNSVLERCVEHIKLTI